MEATLIANLIDLCAVMMLLTSVMAVATTRMRSLVSLFSLQSVFLAALAFIVAYSSGNNHIYIMCALTVALKVIVMPKMLTYIMSKIHVDKEVELSIGIPGSLLASGLMIILSYYITEPLLSSIETVERNCLALSVSIILIGLIVEIGAFFDVMVAVIIIGIFAYRINRSFNSVDTSFLRRLRE